MSSDIFRDRTEGVIARRLDLLRKRRDELITMPHAVRRVVVARSARIAASRIAIGGGLVLAIAAALPSMYGVLERALPGINPAVLSQLLLATWFIAIVTYALARSRAEHRFIVAMSKCVLPGEDVDHDIERLSHEHPDAIAKTMAQRLEVRSAALPILAATLLVPATALYVMESITESGWSKYYEYSLAAEATSLVAFVGIGCAVALVMTRRWARAPMVAPIAAVSAVVALIGVPAAYVLLGRVPMWTLAVAAIPTTIAVIARRLRVERTLIDAVDPAAGSELFSWKKSFVAARAQLRRVPARAYIGAAAFAVAVLVGGGPASYETRTASAIEVQPAAPMPLAAPAVEVADGLSASPGEEVVAVEIYNGIAAEVYGIAGFDKLPRGWKMIARVRPLGPQPGGFDVSALGFGSAMRRDSITTIELSTCGTPSPIGLRIQPKGKEWSGSVKLAIAPRVVYERCDE